ncbi:MULTISPECIES: SAM hydrolase/SAM-dependent halogenase family protein [Niastella]|uniref:SAM-dependent chlorinase/fluorinase n=1 Tax=Niastella soli TaxID=2821487 RepID=A0ABS3Z2U1_9BACT|nr:SAM-dependent chlorinase/fluorinase [Niastella soli]MBO9204481.1 SAM-dependent chlorinase/fluorinase [Niastella soli]
MPLLTLTSDFGMQDYLVGAVKGQLLQQNPEFTLVDVSHTISPFNYPQAAYISRNIIKQFPPNTFHLLLVNLFEKKPEQLLLAWHKEQYILCADNGLLTMMLEDKPEMIIGLPLDPKAIKNTLYCVQVMGEAIQKLHAGARLQDIGIPDVPFLEKNHLRPLFGENWMEGQIIFIDHFENIVVNITREQFEEHRNGRNFKIVFKRNEVIDKIAETYADVNEGEKLALFNAAGYLEIAINKGNAAGLFGLQGFTEQAQHLQNRLFYQTVKIMFG